MQGQLQASERKVCRALDLARSTKRHQAKTSKENPMLKEAIKGIAIRRRRDGYLRVHAQLRRDGWKVNHKRVHRMWKELGLQLPRKRPKPKRPAASKEALERGKYPNDIWAMDFVFDRTTDGKFRYGGAYHIRVNLLHKPWGQPTKIKIYS